MFVVRVSLTQVHVFLKIFQRILNVLLDKEKLKYLQNDAEFGFLYNAYVFALYLNNFI